MRRVLRAVRAKAVVDVERIESQGRETAGITELRQGDEEGRRVWTSGQGHEDSVTGGEQATTKDRLEDCRRVRMEFLAHVGGSATERGPSY